MHACMGLPWHPYKIFFCLCFPWEYDSVFSSKNSDQDTNDLLPLYPSSIDL